jgi:hypothetical protein
MTRDDIIRMAWEAGFEWNGEMIAFDGIWCDEEVELFAALVAAAERNKLAAWMMARGYATGHGDSIEDLLQELDWQIAENWTMGMVNGVESEREACAKVCDAYSATENIGEFDRGWISCAKNSAATIRARGKYDLQA